MIDYSNLKSKGVMNPLGKYDVCKQGIPWPISAKNNFPTEILLVSADCFAENGLSQRKWGLRGKRENSGKMCLMYNDVQREL